MSLGTLFAFAISACGPILRLEDKIVPKNEGSVTLTNPFGPATMSTRGVIEKCELNGLATIKEFSTARPIGPIVRLDGATCDGWTAKANVKPYEPALTPAANR